MVTFPVAIARVSSFMDYNAAFMSFAVLYNERHYNGFSNSCI